MFASIVVTFCTSKTIKELCIDKILIDCNKAVLEIRYHTVIQEKQAKGVYID